MEHKAPDHCRHPNRKNCRHCPDSAQPWLFDGQCKWLLRIWGYDPVPIPADRIPAEWRAYYANLQANWES